MPINLQIDCIIYLFSDLILDPEGAKGEIFKSDDDEAYLIASNKMESPADTRKSEAMGMYIEVRVGGYSLRFVKNPVVCLYRESE